MSVAEMKLIAIAEIGKLEDENAVKEILEHLKVIIDTNENKAHDLSQHYDTIQKQYGDVLKKLAQ
jgi:ArsR family metal-binding transcriptional regulator